jgi:predicted ester cyclase
MGNRVERRGPAAFKAAMASLHEAWREIHARPLLMIAAGDLVACQVEIEGKHHQGSGAWRGVPATGKDATWTGYRVFRLTDGKIAEIRAMEDEFGLLAQLGATITVSHADASEHPAHTAR